MIITVRDVIVSAADLETCGDGCGGLYNAGHVIIIKYGGFTQQPQLNSRRLSRPSRSCRGSSCHVRLFRDVSFVISGGVGFFWVISWYHCSGCASASAFGVKPPPHPSPAKSIACRDGLICSQPPFTAFVSLCFEPVFLVVVVSFMKKRFALDCSYNLHHVAAVMMLTVATG